MFSENITPTAMRRFMTPWLGMPQDFLMRYPLVDGQGNWGSIDGDSAAAMRYTEARMTSIAEQMLSDIQKETVDFPSRIMTIV